MRPRRKSFYVANERIAKLTELSNLPLSQSQSTISEGEHSQNREENAESELSSNNHDNRRQTRLREAHHRSTIATSQSTVSVTANSPRVRPARRQNRLAGIDGRESIETNGNQRRTRSKSTHIRDTTAASKSTVSGIATSARGRPARRQNRLAGIDGRESIEINGNQIRSRSKSTHNRDTTVASSQSTIFDEPISNNNAENQRQTRSKSAQRRNQIAVRQAEPSPNRMDDVPETIFNACKRQKLCANKINGQQIETRRKSITVNAWKMGDLMNFEPANDIPKMRDVCVRLERLDIDTINACGQNKRKPVRRRTIQSILCNGQEAKKIIERRCTVNIDRIELSQDNEERPQSPLSHELSKSNAQTSDSGLPPDRVESSEDERGQNKISTYYGTDDGELSSNISDQNESASLAPIQLSLQQAQEELSNIRNDIEFHDPNEIDRISVTLNSCSRIDFDASNDIDADDENDSNDDASTYCSGLLPLTPINIQQMHLSQASQYIDWGFDRSTSNNSTNTMAVHCDTSPRSKITQYGSCGGQSAINKCFVDSPYVSYGKFIEYGNEMFAINCLDNNNLSIRHHFLTKFSSDHIHALNLYFQGNLWVSEITAHLYLQYSNIGRHQINILEYYKPQCIGNATVTAIEASKFPGGALFLFQAPNQKTIIHVGDLRLHAEITENEFLMKTNIDEIRFDQSMLQRIFHCFPLCTDRYIDLKAEIGHFIENNQESGFHNLIAVGAFDIGMEFFLYELAVSFNQKIYMNTERREFLNHLADEENGAGNICAQLQHNVVADQKAMIHVLEVDEISHEYLMKYISRYNCHRVLGIRPRGCDNALGIVVDGTHKIFDVANPLIGDITEYKRFVDVVIEKSMITPPVPIDHTNQSNNLRN